MMGGRLPQGLDTVGTPVASFTSYEGAQKAVSALIAADVPARDIAIVGHGLTSIERVTRRLGYATAARQGAINGLLLGLLFAAFFVLGTPSPPIQVFVGVLLVGIAIGMLLSIVTYSFVRRRRDFASVGQVAAERYDISVAAGSAARARNVLGPQAAPVAAPASPAEAAAPAPAAPAAPPASAPPRYGERIPEERPGDAAGEAPPADAAEAAPGAGESQPDDDARR
jgi:hypothetical protein